MNQAALTESPSRQFPPSVKEIRNRFIPVIDGAPRSDADRQHAYSDPETGREFEIYTLLDGQHWIFEHVPNGRRTEHDTDGRLLKVWDDPIVIAAKASPNTFNEKISAAGIDRVSLVMMGGGYSIDSKYFSDLDACARAIRRSLQSNTYYSPYRRLSRRERIARDRQSAAESKAWQEQRKAAIEQALKSESGIFRGCYKGLGTPLCHDTKQAVLSYLNSPTLESWKAVRSRNIIGFVTLWQCWLKADPQAPRGDSDQYPSADTIRAAIRHTVDVTLEETTRRIKESPRLGGLTIVK